MEGKSGPASAAAGAAAGIASAAFEPGSSAAVTAGAAAAGEGVFGGWPNVKDGAGLGLTAAEAAEGFVSENGRAEMGGSFALLESCSTGAFCTIVSIDAEPRLFKAAPGAALILTSCANVKPFGLSNRVGSFFGSSSRASSFTSSPSSSSNAAEKRFFAFETGRAMWLREVRVRPTRREDCSRPPIGRAGGAGGDGSLAVSFGVSDTSA